jgi:hypothetical protein
VASITKLKNLLTLAAYNQVHVIKEYDIISWNT